MDVMDKRIDDDLELSVVSQHVVDFGQFFDWCASWSDLLASLQGLYTMIKTLQRCGAVFLDPVDSGELAFRVPGERVGYATFAAIEEDHYVFRLTDGRVLTAPIKHGVIDRKPLKVGDVAAVLLDADGALQQYHFVK